MNSRMIQGVFDDHEPATQALWDGPDGVWDAEANTDRFVAAMPEWRRHGLLSFTVGLQGGNPRGYGESQPWIVGAFASDGSVRPGYFERLARILDQADELGMAPIVSFLYFGQEPRFESERAVFRAVDESTDRLMQGPWQNLIIEIANETDYPPYRHEISKPDRIAELIIRVQERTGRRWPVGTSFAGGKVPSHAVIEASDVVLMHGNSVEEPETMRQLIREAKSSPAYRGQPIVVNEDDHEGFDQPDSNALAALDEGASWGWFDYRRAGEPFEDGCQSVPTDWGIRSARKKAFFGWVADVTGSL